MIFTGFLTLFVTVIALHGRLANGVIVDLVDSDLGIDTIEVREENINSTCACTITVTEVCIASTILITVTPTSTTVNPISTVNGTPVAPGVTTGPGITGTGSMNVILSIFPTTGLDFDTTSAHELSISFAHGSTMVPNQTTDHQATTPVSTSHPATSTSGAFKKTDHGNGGLLGAMTAMLVVCVMGLGI